MLVDKFRVITGVGPKIKVSWFLAFSSMFHLKIECHSKNNSQNKLFLFFLFQSNIKFWPQYLAEVKSFKNIKLFLSKWKKNLVSVSLPPTFMLFLNTQKSKEMWKPLFFETISSSLLLSLNGWKNWKSNKNNKSWT